MMLIVTNVRNTFDNEQSQLLKIVKKRKLPPSARPGCYIQTTKKGSITASPKKYQPLAVSYLLVSPIGITAKALRHTTEATPALTATVLPVTGRCATHPTGRVHRYEDFHQLFRRQYFGEFLIILFLRFKTVISIHYRLRLSVELRLNTCRRFLIRHIGCFFYSVRLRLHVSLTVFPHILPVILKQRHEHRARLILQPEFIGQFLRTPVRHFIHSSRTNVAIPLLCRCRKHKTAQAKAHHKKSDFSHFFSSFVLNSITVISHRTPPPKSEITSRPYTLYI